MKKRRYNPALTATIWAAAVLWVGVLFYLSTQPGAQSSALSSWFTQIILKVFRFVHYQPAVLEPVLRKLAHFCIFAFEGFLLTLAMARTVRNPFHGAFDSALICLLMAAANEYSQLFAEGRSCELRDVMIDGGGALLGVLVALALHQLVRAARRRRRKQRRERAE